MAVARTLTTDRIPLVFGRFWPWLAVAALALPALARWWRPDLPAGADTAIHLLRAVEMDWAIRHGVLFPRWSPDLVFGFGYPLFNVHGPVAQYVIVALHAVGLNFLASTLAAFALADLLAAWGAFALARLIWRSEWAGLLTSVAYVYSPYILGSLYRGSPAEALALGLLPWLLWAFLQLIRAPGLDRLALAAGLYALFPLLHNPSTVLASLALVAVTLAAVLRAAWPGRTVAGVLARLRAPALAVGLGLALSGFYWLPALAEIGAIQIERAYAPNVLNYRFNFVPLAELLSAPQPFDPLLIGWHAPRSYGWPQAALAGLAVGLALWGRPVRAAWPKLALALLGAAACGFLALPAALWVWDHLRGLSLVQFPARLLGPGSLALALAAGAVCRPFAPLRAGTIPPTPILALSAAAIIVFGLAWTFQHADLLALANPTLTDLHDWERRTGSIGTTTAGEYLPVAVKEVPPADKLAARYAVGAPIERLDPASLPPGATSNSELAGLTTQRVTVDSPVAFEAVFDVFYFPGWRATVDGAPVDIRPTDPHGLIVVPVPAGAHTIELRFGTTPPRMAGGVISGGGLLVWLGIVIIVVRRGLPVPPVVPAVVGRRWSVVAFVGLALLALRLWAGASGTTWYARTRFDGAAVAGIDQQRDLDFGGQMGLLGYDGAQQVVPSGTAVDVTLYWRAAQPLTEDYSTSLALVDEEGFVYAEANSQHPAGLPTSRWGVEQYGRDVHRLQLAAGTPPGTYHLVANVFRPSDLAALTAGMAVGTVEVTRAARPATLEPPQTIGASFGPIELAGAELGLAEVAVGDDLPLTLYWRASAPASEDRLALIVLIDAGGQIAAEASLPPVGTHFPLTAWRPGDEWLARRALRIPAGVAAGAYTVAVSLVGPAAVPAPVAIGRVSVTAPERSFTAPPVANALSARFGDVAALAGWELEANRLKLVWRALNSPDMRYTVFVHVRDAAGELFSQRDAPPGSGFRPTTSWLRGEYIQDEYLLDLPPGTFSLAVGLYDQRTGERLRLPDGADWVELLP